MRYLERFFSPPSSSGSPQGSRLPSLDVRGAKLPSTVRPSGPRPHTAQLPNASLVYGIGAAMLLAFALYSLFTGAWVVSLMILLPAGALFGYALHYMRYFS